MTEPLSNNKLNRRIRQRTISAKEIVGQRNHFTIERWGVGWAINVHRRGRPVNTVLCHTEGEANRVRRELTDQGLIGVNGGAK